MGQTANLINIKRYLPHRAPMLMVDLIITMNSQKAETTFEIKEDNIFIQNATFMEAGLIENMAQTCSSIVAKDYLVDENNHEIDGVDVVGFISAIKTLKIHSLPKVGDVIITKALLVSKFVSDTYCLCSISCKTFCEDALLLEGEINLYIQENNSHQ